MSKIPPQGAKATKENWRDLYQTPAYIMDLVYNFFPIVGDPFPAEWNGSTDGFTIPWGPEVYINPPFSRYLEAVKHGLTQPTEQIWICNHDSSTERWKLLWDASSAVCFLNERIKFIDPRTGKPTVSTDPAKSQNLFYRGNRPDDFIVLFSSIGRCVKLASHGGHAG